MYHNKKPRPVQFFLIAAVLAVLFMAGYLIFRLASGAGFFDGLKPSPTVSPAVSVTSSPTAMVTPTIVPPTASIGVTATPTTTEKPTTSPTSAVIEIISGPGGHYAVLGVQKAAISSGSLVLVNSKNKCTFSQDRELVNIYKNKASSYRVSNTNYLLNKNVMPQLNSMLSAFSKSKDLKNLMVISGYRTYEGQNKLFTAKVSSVGVNEAMLWVARPGFSEHHTGYAFDLGLVASSGSVDYFEGTGKYAWLNENCWKYGFILRYPPEKTSITGIAHETWHYRFVGTPHAYYMVKNGLCLEEYIDLLRNYTFDGERLQISGYGGAPCEVYFVPAADGITRVPVPENGDYNLSGNNADGFIVTAYDALEN